MSLRGVPFRYPAIFCLIIGITEFTVFCRSQSNILLSNVTIRDITEAEIRNVRRMRATGEYQVARKCKAAAGNYWLFDFLKEVQRQNPTVQKWRDVYVLKESDREFASKDCFVFFGTPVEREGGSLR